jgi:coronin-1B/1C/6
MLRLFDARAKLCESETQVHDSSKGFQTVWLGDQPDILTVGFSKSGTREYSIFDTRTNKIRTTNPVDQGSNPLQPIYDATNNIVYLIGKGDGNIRIYDLADQSTTLAEYTSTVPQRAVWALPSRCMNIHSCEIARFLKLTTSAVESISFKLPRKNLDLFQEDVYGPVPSGEPTMNITEWITSTEAAPQKMTSLKPEDMKSIYEVPVTEGGKKRPGTIEEDEEGSSEEEDEEEDEQEVDEAVEPAQEVLQQVVQEQVPVEPVVEPVVQESPVTSEELESDIAELIKSRNRAATARRKGTAMPIRPSGAPVPSASQRSGTAHTPVRFTTKSLTMLREIAVYRVFYTIQTCQHL